MNDDDCSTMSDHWPRDRGNQPKDILRPLLQRPSTSSGKSVSSSSRPSLDIYDDDNSTKFDNSFVVRPNQRPPELSDDERSSSQNRSSINSGRSMQQHQLHQLDQEEKNHQDNVSLQGSMGGLSTSYATTEQLPIFGHNSRSTSSGSGTASRASRAGGEADHRQEQEERVHHRHHHDREGKSKSRRKKKHRSDRHRYEEVMDEASIRSSFSSVQGNSRSKPRDFSRAQRPDGGSGGVLSAFNLSTFNRMFEGVNLKTVMFCMVGMTMMSKINQNNHPGPDANYGVANRSKPQRSSSGAFLNLTPPGKTGTAPGKFVFGKSANIRLTAPSGVPSPMAFGSKATFGGGVPFGSGGFGGTGAAPFGTSPFGGAGDASSKKRPLSTTGEIGEEEPEVKKSHKEEDDGQTKEKVSGDSSKSSSKNAAKEA